MQSFVVLAILAATCACTPPPRCPPTAPAAAATVPAAIGEALTLDSKAIGERRVVNVYLPPDYATSGARYPVLYMPDGGLGEDFPHVVGSVDVSIKNAVIRPVIVVGVENTERRRDLVGATTVAEELEMAPHAGGNDEFRAFLRDELKPYIAGRYRTSGESAIIGESLAGLFVVETFLLEPTLFDSYIAADPSVWWNQETLVRGTADRLAGWPGGAKALYIATSSEMKGDLALLTDALGAAAIADLTWVHEPMPEAKHGTIFPTAALHGIRMIFSASQPAE